MSGDFFDTNVLLYLHSSETARVEILLALAGAPVIGTGMTITLDPDQEAWLEARVASGDFASVEEAARRLIAERIAELVLEENDDMAWAKPYVDEALAEVERGEVISFEEHEARNDARLSRMT